jgi:predicted NBD/HSP70 family sugar kinase
MTAATTDVPVRQASLRTHNLGLVLRQVAASAEPISRADVAAATGLTKATVSTLVDELLGGGLLVEVDPPPRTGSGRPAIGLRLAAKGPAGLGVEITVDAIATCVVDLTGAVRVALRQVADQREREPGAVLADAAALAADALATARSEGVEPAGLAVAVPGLVSDGVVRLAPNLGWREVNVAAAFTDGGLPGPPSVENGASLAALGELQAIGDGGASFLYINGEADIGAGVVLNGHLHRGSRGYAGELGHVTIRPDGPRCRCGARGCLQTYASLDVILAAAGLDGAPLARLAALARAGAHPALMALDEAGTALGVAAADAVNLLDVETVVLGGGYALLAPWLIGPLEREIADRVTAHQWAPVTARASTHGESATVMGAANSIVRAIHAAPATYLRPT